MGHSAEWKDTEQRHSRAENFLASFAKEKEKKAPTYLLGGQGQQERFSSTPPLSSTQSYLAGFFSPSPA